jgi:hypothetical protein
MHPEILRQIIEQRSRESQARAAEGRLANQLIRALRSQRRHGSPITSDYAIPAIPDFVDGSFAASTASQASPAGQAKSAAGPVPAARNAA